MKNFNKWLYSEYGTFNFEFANVLSPKGNKYFVNVSGNEGPVTAFEMKSQGSENWVVVHPAPDWTLKIQPELNEIIKTHGNLAKRAT